MVDQTKLSVGQRISHYEIEAGIGAGGMGEVYLAKDGNLGRSVAIKLLPDFFTTDADRLRRFKQEARTASALNHPNIITIYEIGQHQGSHFIATEFIDGITLRQKLWDGQLKLREALDIAYQAALALTAAHEAKIIHRDIKPENVMVRRDGIVKVLDFGLAKLTETTATAVDAEAATKALVQTEPGRVMGTVSYMSPEQARGFDVDARTDIWSLGVVLYEMVTGRKPFTGETSSHIAVAILEKEPVPLAIFAPLAPAELQRIVRKALAKDRDERHQTARDLLIDLKSLRQELEFEAKLELSAHPQSSGGAAVKSGGGPAAAEIGRREDTHTSEVQAARTTSSIDYLVGGIKQKGFALALVGVGLATVVALTFGWHSQLAPKIVGYTQITNDGRPKYVAGAIVTDGARLYFGEALSTQPVISQVSVAGGETAPVPISLPGTSARVLVLWDISPNRSELLFVDSDSATQSEGPVWVLPVPGGIPHRLGDVRAHDAAWSPDRQRIVYANGPDVFIAKDDGTASRKLLTAPVPTSLRWSPDGSRLRFTQRNPNTGLGSLWEVSADGSNLHQLLPGWNSPSAECCGMWTPDGRCYLFLSQQPFNATSNIWVIREADSFFRRGNSAPVQLTSGPLSFTQFGLSADGKKVFSRGELVRGELQRYDEKSGHFVTYLSGVSAEGVNFSGDGEWVTYVAYPEFTLWRSRVDGSERLQLSFPPMWAALPHWSPDGKRIAFVATTPGKPTKIYLISAEGGAPEELFPEGRSQMDPSWTPDGKSVVFGRDAGTETKEINLFDLRTKQVSALPGSEGLFSPRCSPDGRYVAAMSADSKKLMLNDFTT